MPGVFAEFETNLRPERQLVVRLVVDQRDDPDEHDPEPPPGTLEEDDGTWVLDGDVHVDEIERAIGHTLPDGDYETVSGLLIATHGALPAQGDVIVVPIEPESVLETLDETRLAGR